MPPQFHPVIDIAARDRVGFSACGVGSDLGWLLGATLWNLPPERPVVIEPSVGGVPETDPNMVFSLLRCTNRACDAGLGRDTDTSPLYGCEKKRAEIREYSKEQGRLSVLITLEFSGDIRSELDLDLTWDPAQVPPSKYDDPVGGAGGMGGTPGAPSAGAGGR
ncbi:MAG: hypothetical protein SFV15_05455 [Polyangiaceae bacterium]|nr:hypothetical protein [Polyangiaceae bacterium]